MAIEIRNTVEHLLSKNPAMAKDVNHLTRNDLLSKGVSGSKTVSGNAAQSVAAGTYWAVMFIKPTTPTALTMSISTCVTGIEYPAGTWLYGDIRTITGDSNGAYILYYGDASL